MNNKKWLYDFSEGDGSNKQLLGGKGANLCEMTQIGLAVPPGFVITTEACLDYLDSDSNELPDGIMDQVRDAIKKVEQDTGKGFGNADNPLLVSVRSGSAMSMPGMMDTILNLGLNEETLMGEIKQTGDARFGYDAFRRFIQLFGKVALDIPDELFDEQFNLVKQQAHVSEDVGLSADNLQDICNRFLKVFEEQTGKPFPSDPYEQLEVSIKAVFNSWSGKRAVDYRREFKITPEQANGTAVNICTMVFGNRGDDSATGVAFTRNPGTGENLLYGEYLVNAQGEDVVAGIRTPKPIIELSKEMPEMATQLEALRKQLETHYREVQDFEFTIERGILYCLQTRNGKMNAAAMVRTSVEMEREELISREEALLRIDPEHLEQMLHPHLDKSVLATPIAQGLPASPGAASGYAVFDADRAEELAKTGTQQLILVREETKPEDIHGFFVAEGVLTSRGGKTSHAAVVARSMGKPCVAGADGIHIDDKRRMATVGNTEFKEGDMITLDGTSGNIYIGRIPTIEAEFTEELKTLLSWADDIAKLDVMANADTEDDAQRATKYGAVGIGLCRTERMFNSPERLPVVIKMIVAEDLEERQEALDLLLPMQRSDFKALFKTMSPMPVTIRLLDPPIHEFLPSEKQLQQELVELKHMQKSAQGVDILMNTINLLDNTEGSKEKLAIFNQSLDANLIRQAIDKKQSMLKKVRILHETNPMLGHRGVRLGITFPEIYSMQIRSILEAAAECLEEGIEIKPRIKIPQVCTSEELKAVRKMVDQVSKEVEAQHGKKIDFEFGTMIEVVRACLRADSMAKQVDFFSFGTNDLTQAVFSFSREDAENKFLPLYNDNSILQDNPFEVLDGKGTGKLMKLAVDWGREVHPDLHVGICGEHGGHPQSIHFCHQIGLDYVSCSAPRIPVARLAAAHASLLNKE